MHRGLHTHMHLIKGQRRLGWLHGADRVAGGTSFVRCAQRAPLRQPVNSGPISYHRHAARLAAASNDSETTTRKPAMPVLPPRMHKRQPAPADTKDNVSKPDTSSSKGPPKRKRPRSSPQQPQFPGGGGPNPEYLQERALAGLLAYTGMMGTIATATSFIVPGLHLFGNFHLDTSDLMLGLKLMAPVYLMNVLIMFPNYSCWHLPEPSAESKQQMVEALTKFQNSRASRRKGIGSSSSSEAAESGVTTASTDNSPPAAQPAAETVRHEAAYCSTNTASSSSDGAQDTSSPPAVSSTASADPASAPAEVSSSSRPGDLSSLWAQPLASSSSSSSSQSTWLQDQVSKSPALSRTKDALFLAQGHCLAQNPALILPPVVQVAVLLAECLAAELLYRSVTLQLTGGWISDRLYEGGADELLAAVTTALPVQPSTQVAGQLIALALLSSAWGVAVLQRVFSRRRPLVLGVLGVQGKGNKEAADQLLQELRESSEQQQHSSKADDAAASSNSNSSEGLKAEAGDPAADVDQQDKLSSSSSSLGSQSEAQQQQAHLAASEQQPQQPKQQQPQKSAQQQQQLQQQQHVDKQLDVQDQQWSRRTLPATVSAMAWSRLICGVRDVSQATALGLGFVLTGNLAAPFAAAVVNQLLFTALQKRAVERARKRSQAIATQLAGLARQLRDMQRKQLESKRQLESQKQTQQQEHSAAAATGLQDHLEGSHAMKAADNQQEQVAPDVLHGSDAAGDDAVGSAGCVLGSRMERTINVLDQLLGEQLNGAAAAGPGSSGK